MVFPNKVVSQTISTYDEAKITNPSTVYSQPEPDEVSRAYESWLLTQQAEKLKGRYGGPCVTFARNFTKATPADVSGMAKNVPTNTTTPEVGEIVKTNESHFGHLAVVIEMDEDSLTVVESNYHWNGVIGIRQISLTDPNIIGYIKIN
ncbi:MAG: CHAP domain-containing protein [Minisyncoccia bacterium]